MCARCGVSVLREQLTPQFRRAEDVEVVIGPQLLAAIPDFSFLWNPAKARRNFSSAYLTRRWEVLRTRPSETEDRALVIAFKTMRLILMEVTDGLSRSCSLVPWLLSSIALPPRVYS